MNKNHIINEIKMEVQGRIIPIQVIRSGRKSIGLDREKAGLQTGKTLL